MKYYEKQLPQGYVSAKVVDAKNNKFGLILNLVALGLMIVVFVAGWFAMFKTTPVATVWEELLTDKVWLPLVHLGIFLVMYVAYIVLHELTHGVVYKLFTKQKLSFGLTLTVAYCGVPDIYVYRTVAMCALLAPFVVYNVVFLVPLFFISDVAFKLIVLAMLALHVGGCAGDLYDTILYLFKFRDGKTLMRDTGPKQEFFLPCSNLEQQNNTDDGATAEEGFDVAE